MGRRAGAAPVKGEPDNAGDDEMNSYDSPDDGDDRKIEASSAPGSARSGSWSETGERRREGLSESAIVVLEAIDAAAGREEQVLLPGRVRTIHGCRTGGEVWGPNDLNDGRNANTFPHVVDMHRGDPGSVVESSNIPAKHCLRVRDGIPQGRRGSARSVSRHWECGDAGSHQTREA